VNSSSIPTMGLLYLFLILLLHYRLIAAAAVAQEALFTIPDPSTWTSLGGVAYGTPAACQWAGTRMHLFVRGGTNNDLYFKFFSGSKWGANYDAVGGRFTSSLSCVETCSTCVDAFGRGTDGQMFQKSWRTKWLDYAARGGQLMGAPSCVSAKKGRIDCFAQFPDNGLYRISANEKDVWSEWKLVPDTEDTLDGDPNCISRIPTSIDCAYRRRRGGALTVLSFEGDKVVAKKDTSVAISDTPTLFSTDADNMGVILRTASGTMGMAKAGEGDWSNAFDLNIRLEWPVAAVARNGNVELFATCSSGETLWTTLGVDK